jgi:phospholipase/lecithinase/hemolysin
MVMQRKLASLVAGLVFLLTGANVWATAFTGLYAFGDSLSDSGSSPSSVLSIYNFLGGCDPFHPCPPYYEGRYSNGPVAVEYLADSILPGGATPANFYNFAVSGATTGVGNYGDGGTATNPGAYGLPGMYQEIGLYLTTSGGTADPNALYFVWGGANDLLTLDSPVLAAQNIAGYVGALAAAGAEHILVPNLPDLSYTPFVQSEGLQALAQAFSVGFNTELAAQLGGLNLLFPGTDIIQFDTFSFLNDVVLNPANYGLANSQDACLPSIMVAPCADPDNYVFWDVFHPTTRADAIIASAFAEAVPEPGTVALFAVGLFALMAAVTRRRERALARRGL